MDKKLKNLPTEERNFTSHTRLLRIAAKKSYMITISMLNNLSCNYYFSPTFFNIFFNITLSTLTPPAYCSLIIHIILYSHTLIDNCMLCFAIPSGLMTINITLKYNIRKVYFIETEFIILIN